MERLLKEGRMAKMEHNRMTPRQQLPAFGEKDPQLQARVRTLFKDNFFSVMVTMLYGLVCLMYVPSVSNVLEATKKTNTRVGAFSRYLNTINHVIAWIGKDMLARRQSLLQVRMLHTRANRTAVAKYGQDGAMSQFDMVVTQWAFVGPFFIFPERVGISTITRRDLEAIAHYMYVVGYVMGVKDEFNLCAGSPEEVTRYCKFVHEKVILPCLEQPHSRAIDMATRLLNGMEHLNPFIRPSSFIACMLKAFKADSHRYALSELSGQPWVNVGICGYYMPFKLTWLYQMMDKVMMILCISPMIGKFMAVVVFNPLLNFNIWLANRWRRDIEEVAKHAEIENQ